MGMKKRKRKEKKKKDKEEKREGGVGARWDEDVGVISDSGSGSRGNLVSVLTHPRSVMPIAIAPQPPPP